MHFGSGRDAYFMVAMAVPFLEFALLLVIDFPCIVCYFFQEILVCKKKIFLQKNPLSVTCTTVAYVCHITDIFIITEFSQNYLTLNSFTNTARSYLPTNPSRWC